MKKKLLFLLLIVVGLFTITGCAADNDKSAKEKFVDLSYIKPEGSTSKNEFGTDKSKIVSYLFKEDSTGISLNYVKGENESYIEEFHSDGIKTEEINGTTWKVVDDEDLGVKTRTYYVVHGDALYYIELNGMDKYEKEFIDFIKNVSF